MNGNFTPELVADRIADLERSAARAHRGTPRRVAPVRSSLGHFLVVVGTRLEGGAERRSPGVAGVVSR